MNLQNNEYNMHRLSNNSRASIMTVGMYVYCLGTIAAGIINLIWGDFQAGYQPIQAFGDHIPGREILVYIFALVLVPMLFISASDQMTWGSNAYNLTAVGAVWIYADSLANHFTVQGRRTVSLISKYQ